MVRTVFNSYMKILITGGSGSLGRALIKLLHPANKIYSLTNDEYQHWEVEKDFGIESFLCDIREYGRLEEIFDQIKPDVCIHAAALKHVPFGERFPQEFFMINVIGSKNVAEICHSLHIPKCILISTDKAVKPATMYGRSKQRAEEIFLENQYSVIRFGNFWASRGSVIPLWQEQAKNLGYITITDPKMERYFITLEDAASFTMKCLDEYTPKTVWTPKMKKWTLAELAQEICPDVPQKIIGNRGNEKQVEVLQ